jgi:hypothetical protein
MHNGAGLESSILARFPVDIESEKKEINYK